MTQEDLDTPEEGSSVTKPETVLWIAAATVMGVVVYRGLHRISNWRENRKLDKMQEEYNKIWDEYKYYQGEQTAE